MSSRIIDMSQLIKECLTYYDSCFTPILALARHLSLAAILHRHRKGR